MEKNVFGEVLEICCIQPMTGYFRDGLCRTIAQDTGTHTVCAVMTNEFLRFSAAQGNDLITPIPYYQFPGLKAGDKWCLCVSRWVQAQKAGKALAYFGSHTRNPRLCPFSALGEVCIKQKTPRFKFCINSFFTF